MQYWNFFQYRIKIQFKYCTVVEMISKPVVESCSCDFFFFLVIKIEIETPVNYCSSCHQMRCNMGISAEKPGMFSCRQNGKIREGKGLVCHSAESCDVLSDKMDSSKSKFHVRPQINL